MAPQILAKKDRGKPTESSKQVVLAEYGSLQSKSFLPGAEILPVDKGTYVLNLLFFWWIWILDKAFSSF